jgi:hypothetical protein
MTAGQLRDQDGIEKLIQHDIMVIKFLNSYVARLPIGNLHKRISWL